MGFQHPQILFGLFLLGIPVLIHFLNFRRTRTVYFSSIKFLREVESSHRNRRNLQNLILLLIRMLIMAFLIIAFAKPVVTNFPGQSMTDDRVGLFLDNSSSMEIQKENESLFSLAKKSAVAVIRSFPQNTKFFLITNGKNLDFQGTADPEMAVEKIDQLESAIETKPIGTVMQAFQHEAAQSQNHFSAIYLFSDFCKSAFAKPIPNDSSDVQVYPVLVRVDSVPNLSLDSCWFENPIHQVNQTEILSVLARNFSDQDIENLPVKLYINDSLRNELIIQLPARSKKTVEIPFTVRSQGWQQGRIAISDYPYEPDNELFFTYPIESGIPVLHLYENKPNRFFSSLFKLDGFYRYEEFSVRGFPRADFTGYNLLVLTGIRYFDNSLSEKLKSYLEKGGTVWFLPELNGQLVNYNNFLSSLKLPVAQSLVTYTVESELGPGFKDWLENVVINPGKQLRLPVVHKSLRFPENQPDRVDLLSAIGGDLLMSQYPAGKGRFILTAFPLDEEITDLMFHPLFVPLVMHICTIGSTDFQLYQPLGSAEPIKLASTLSQPGGVVKMFSQYSDYEIIPEIRSGVGGNTFLYTPDLEKAGFYFLKQGPALLYSLAFNSNRKESDLSLEPDSLINMHFIQSGWKIRPYSTSSHLLTEKVPKGSQPVKRLWSIFLLAAITLLVIESFVMNRKK